MARGVVKEREKREVEVEVETKKIRSNLFLFFSSLSLRYLSAETARKVNEPSTT